MVSEVWKNLEQGLAGRILYDVPLAPLTSFGVGGRAEVLARPETEGDLAVLLDFCRANHHPYFVLGGGTNVLFPDDALKALVIKLGNSFTILSPEGDGRLSVGAAAGSAQVMALAAELSLRGLECLAGIPGSIGGAVRMNAGAGGGAVGDAVAGLRYVGADGRIGTRAAEELTFGYRRLEGLPAGAVITHVSFDLTPDERSAVNARTQEIMKGRGLNQPKGWRSAGCVFKNPPGESAGRLLDACGLKGARIGAAVVSDVHANFILNQGGAGARDILELMRLMASAVETRFGIGLEPELRIVSSSGEVIGI